ncbi:MAG: NTP transferase domain-containing protein [Cryobacterium sp.]
MPADPSPAGGAASAAGGAGAGGAAAGVAAAAGSAVLVDLLVLAGGRGSRLGGALKPAVDVAGRTLLSRVLDARPLVRRVVVVAPNAARPAAGTADRPDAASGLVWVLEDPPFGGPVAGIAAGLAALGDGHDTAADGGAHTAADWVLVLACDLPWAADAARHLLSHLADPALPPTLDGVYLVDDTGRDQWLVGVYRVAALRAGAARLGPAVHGASVRQLLTGLELRGLPDPSGASADVDTWQDVTHSAERLSAEQRGAPPGTSAPAAPPSIHRPERSTTRSFPSLSRSDTP